jgi:HAD superfamily hydrolase (TIGR01509 family)
MLQAIIFDMDGVLIDSEPIHYNADTEIFNHLGIVLSHEDRSIFVGMGAEGVYSWLKERYLLAQSLEELLDFDNQFRLDFFRSHELSAIPGIPRLLRALQTHGLPMAVASSSVRSHVDYILSALGLSGFFTITLAGDEVEHTKPDPGLFLKAAELLNVAPENCLVIEDSKNGIIAAKAAGMRCVAYANQSVQSIGDVNVSRIIHSFEELTPEILFSIMDS